MAATSRSFLKGIVCSGEGNHALRTSGTAVSRSCPVQRLAQWGTLSYRMLDGSVEGTDLDAECPRTQLLSRNRGSSLFRKQQQREITCLSWEISWVPWQVCLTSS